MRQRRARVRQGCPLVPWARGGAGAVGVGVGEGVAGDEGEYEGSDEVFPTGPGLPRNARAVEWRGEAGP